MKSKIISFIVVMLLLTLMVGVTYSFFNYTRTGSENTISVGRISFTSSQNNTINLTNVFPARSDNLNNSNSDTVTVNITGDTTYTGGIEYKVTIEDINNTINTKEIPLSFKLTTSNLGEKSNEYWSDRGSTANVYNLVENGVAEEGKYILVGYIKPDSVGVNGSIDITAYIDTDQIAISDTYSRIENNELIIGETTSEWADGRMVLTTEEWNSFTNSPISFKVKVEANEGLWVEEEKSFVLKNLNGIQAWKDIRTNITSVEFHKDGIVPENPIATIDATDITSTGPVTVYTVDDGLGNNTYKAIVVADDTIYAPSDSTSLFQRMTNLVNFDSQNFKVDNVINMSAFFSRCSNLKNIQSLSQWNTSNVVNMLGLFNMCSSLENINSLVSWNTKNVENMQQMFTGCVGIENVGSLTNWNVKKVTNMAGMFMNCASLEIVDLSGWETNSLIYMNNMFNMIDYPEDSALRQIVLSNKFYTGNVKYMQYLFNSCISIEDYSFLKYFDTRNVIDMSALFSCNDGLVNLNYLKNWDISNVTSMSWLFMGCINLSNIESLANWNVSNVMNMDALFKGCINLINIDSLSNWNVSNVMNMSYMFWCCSNLVDISPLVNWNAKTGNVTNMGFMFGSHADYMKINDAIIDFSPLANWNVTNVEDMSSMFQNINIQSYEPFRNWNVSKVQNFSGMFNSTAESPIMTLSGLENWNVSSATDMSGMFFDNYSLIDASAINNWDINANIDFTQMFYHTPVHPNFTNVSGTWNSEGTFIPNI